MGTRRSADRSDGAILRRAIVWIAALAVAAVTGLIQLDQQVRVSPGLAPMVPALFKSRALTAEVESGVATKQEGILPKARLLVLRRPVPADSLAMLGLAAFAKGDNTTADKALAAAASRGWRVPIVNLLAIQGALTAKDWQSATFRLVALRKLRSADAFTTQGLALIAKDPAGRLALSDYAAKDPGFATFLVQAAMQTMPPEAAVAMLRRAKAQGAVVSCSDVAWATRSLLTLGKADLANSYWKENCAKESSSDLGLDSAQMAKPGNGPFDWQFAPQPGLSREARSEGIFLRNRDPIRRPFAKRLLTLPAGSYTLSPTVKTRAQGPAVAAADISVEVACYPRESQSRTTTVGGDTVLQVPPTCPVQEVTLLVDRGEAMLTGFAIKPNGNN